MLPFLFCSLAVPWSFWTGIMRCGTWLKVNRFARIHGSPLQPTLPGPRQPTCPQTRHQKCWPIPPTSFNLTSPQTQPLTRPPCCPLTLQPSSHLKPQQTAHPTLTLRLRSAILRPPSLSRRTQHQPTHPAWSLWARRWSQSMMLVCGTSQPAALSTLKPTLKLTSNQMTSISNTQAFMYDVRYTMWCTLFPLSVCYLLLLYHSFVQSASCSS